MNKVLNINLGRAPFVIDDNAYEALANYIDGLRRHFGNSEGCEEIIADIEARIAELFNDYLKDRQIVTLADVKRAIGVMGIPTDIDNNTNTGATGASAGAAGGNRNDWKAGKRLFRNEDDKVISGVCSGLAAYLGFQDPLWMRLAWAAMLFFSGGFVAAVYILLIIVVPKAQSAADKLAMRGENVNVDNIARTVEQEIGNIGQRLNEFGHEITDGINGKKSNGDGAFGTRAASYSSGGETLVAILKGLVKAILLFILITAFFSLASVWVAFLIAGVHAQPYMHYFVDSPTAAYVGSAALLISLIVPIIAVVLAMVRIFYRNVKIKGIALWGLGLLWLGSVLTLIVIGTTVFRQFATSDSSTQDITLLNPNVETMSIELKPDDHDDSDLGIHLGDMFLRGDVLMSDEIEFDVAQSPDAQFHLIQKNTARGATAVEARRAADEVEYKIVQTDSSLLFDPLLSLPKGAKCKWQKVKLTLQVPIGKKVRVKNVEHDGSDFDDFTNDIYLARTESCKDNDSDNDPREVFMYKTRTWRMGQNGLLCDDCTPEELKRFTINTDKDDEDNEDYGAENDNNDDNDQNNDSNSDSTSINISGDDAKIKLDENGLSIKSNKKGENVEIKIDEDGFKVKKNGKTIRPNEN